MRTSRLLTRGGFCLLLYAAVCIICVTCAVAICFHSISWSLPNEPGPYVLIDVREFGYYNIISQLWVVSGAFQGARGTSGISFTATKLRSTVLFDSEKNAYELMVTKSATSLSIYGVRCSSILIPFAVSTPLNILWYQYCSSSIIIVEE